MTAHLSVDDLRQWRDGETAADRDRIVGHLAACDTCGIRYAELLRTQPLETGPTVLRPEDFIARGKQVRRTSLFAKLMRALDPGVSWQPLRVAAAVAAVMVLAVLIWPVSRPPDSGVRGSAIELLSPSGTVSGRLEFRWNSPVSAARYRIEVLDGDGSPALYTTEVASERVDLTDALRGRLQPGQEYAWKVTALDSQDTAITESQPQRFMLAPNP